MNASADASYRETLSEFERLVRYAATLSVTTSGLPVRDWRLAEGSRIFAKLAMHGVSIRRLAPSGLLPGPGESELWDLSSICALVRCLVDAYSALRYVAVDEISEEEGTFRRRLWFYHSELRRLEGLRLINSTRPEVAALEQEVQELRAALVSDPYYATLTAREQERMRKGEVALHLTNSQIAERAGIHPEYYKALYRYLSNYTHTYAFCVAQLMSFRAGDPESLELIQVALRYGCGYLAFADRDFGHVAPGAPALPDDVAKIIATWERLVVDTITVGSGADAHEE